MTLLARLTQHHVPVIGDRSWIAEAIANADPPLDPYDVHLVEAAEEFDWLLAEILLRLYNGDTAGLSLVDFISPSTVLALWYALRPDKRRYLRAVFGTEAHPTPEDADRLTALDRLVKRAGDEVPAALDLLAILTTPNPVLERAFEEFAAAGVSTDLPADTLRDLRGFTQQLLRADDPEEVAALVNARWPDRELPPRPEELG